MIFKKTDNWTQSKPTSNGKSPMPVRREPELSRQSPVSQPFSSSAAMVTPAAPHTAQTRRTPAGNYGRDQLRKLTVGRDISLNGEITTCDHLVVEGNVSATIKGGKVLEIAESGAFSGVVDIEQADIAGQFDGNLTVRGKLTVRASARVTGQIRYTALQVDTGATINGDLQSVAETSAPTVTQDAAMPAQPRDTAASPFNFANTEPGFLKASA